MIWLSIVSMAFLYNCMASVLRGTFTACPIYACSEPEVVPFCLSDPLPSFTTTLPHNFTDTPFSNATFSETANILSFNYSITTLSSSSQSISSYTSSPSRPSSDNHTSSIYEASSQRPAIQGVRTIYSAKFLSDKSLIFCRAMLCRPKDRLEPRDARTTQSLTSSLPPTTTRYSQDPSSFVNESSLTTVVNVTNAFSTLSSLESTILITSTSMSLFSIFQSPFFNSTPDLNKTSQVTPAIGNSTFELTTYDAEERVFTNVGTKNRDCVIIGCFPGYETDQNRYLWWIFDYLCDFIYIADMLLVKTRVTYIRDGMLEVIEILEIINYVINHINNNK